MGCRGRRCWSCECRARGGTPFALGPRPCTLSHAPPCSSMLLRSPSGTPRHAVGPLLTVDGPQTGASPRNPLGTAGNPPEILNAQASKPQEAGSPENLKCLDSCCKGCAFRGAFCGAFCGLLPRFPFTALFAALLAALLRRFSDAFAVLSPRFLPCFSFAALVRRLCGALPARSLRAACPARCTATPKHSRRGRETP